MDFRTADFRTYKSKTTAMKQKFFYLLTTICLLSLFSEARPGGKEYCTASCCRFIKQASAKTPREIEAKKQADVDLPPLKLLQFGL